MTDTAIITTDNLPEIDFSPAQGQVVIDLSRVRAYQPNGTIEGLQEVALPQSGWSETHEGKPWKELGLSAEEQVQLALDLGATAVQFLISYIDRFGGKNWVRPDFGIREITRPALP